MSQNNGEIVHLSAALVRYVSPKGYELEHMGNISVPADPKSATDIDIKRIADAVAEGSLDPTASKIGKLYFGTKGYYVDGSHPTEEFPTPEGIALAARREVLRAALEKRRSSGRP